MCSSDLKCMGYLEKDVLITNTGTAPVPAGTNIKFAIPVSPTPYGGTYPENDGTYMFTKPLPGGAQIGIGPPPPNAIGGGGSSSEPWAMGALAVYGLAELRPCTISIVFSGGVLETPAAKYVPAPTPSPSPSKRP